MGSTSRTLRASLKSRTVSVVRLAARMKRRASLMTWPSRYSTSWARIRSGSSDSEIPIDSAVSRTLSAFHRSLGPSAAMAAAAVGDAAFRFPEMVGLGINWRATPRWSSLEGALRQRQPHSLQPQPHALLTVGPGRPPLLGNLFCELLSFATP